MIVLGFGAISTFDVCMHGFGALSAISPYRHEDVQTIDLNKLDTDDRERIERWDHLITPIPTCLADVLA